MAGKDNLMPPVRSKEDPRYIALQEGRQKMAARQNALKLKKQQYEAALKEFKATQFEEAQERMANGEISTPAMMLMNMIQEQEIAVQNPSLTQSELNKEKELLLKLWDRYDRLTGASAPSAQQISVENNDTSEESPEDIESELKKFTEGKVVKFK